MPLLYETLTAGAAGGIVSGMAKLKKTTDAPYDLKGEREAIGLTQEDVAEGVTVTQAAVSKWESGKTKLKGPALRQVKQFMAAAARRKKRKEDAPAREQELQP